MLLYSHYALSQITTDSKTTQYTQQKTNLLYSPIRSAVSRTTINISRNN